MSAPFCHECGQSDTPLTEEWRDEEFGEGVVMVGVTARVCPCGNYMVEIPRITLLLDLTEKRPGGGRFRFDGKAWVPA